MATVEHGFSGYKAHQEQRRTAKSMRERGFKNVRQRKEGYGSGRTFYVKGELPKGISEAEKGR